jgi:hypothetical protein
VIQSPFSKILVANEDYLIFEVLKKRPALEVSGADDRRHSEVRGKERYTALTFWYFCVKFLTVATLNPPKKLKN